MKVDGAIYAAPDEAGAAARKLEELGYDAGYTFEGPHDPFFPLAVAAGQTERLELATAVAIAFARNPMLLANIGYDMQLLAKGRFILGLGSQIKPHIEKRFSMPWSRPAARMRELVQAVRAIWAAWHEGEKLDFRGEFYTHTLMIPTFNPGPNPHGLPRIFVAGVGPKMTEVAGEVADGFFVHPFHTVESWKQVTRPSLEAGRGGSLGEFEIAAQLIAATGTNDEEREAAMNAARAQIAFYASTPAYKVVLDCHGWGDLQTRLNRMSKEGRWLEMANEVPDEVVETIAVVGAPGEIADKVRARCGDWATRVALTNAARSDPEAWTDIIRDLKQS